MHFVPHNNSNNMRNEEQTRALQESGAALSRARFDSMPNPEEFRGRLKNQLLEKRQLKRTSMWEKFKEVLSHIIPTQKTFVFGMVVVLLVAVVTTMLVNRPGVTPRTNSPFASLLIDKAYAKDNFEIIPTSGDGLAVDSTTEFIIKSKTALQKSELEKYLTLSPVSPFQLTQISEHEFRLTPQNALEQKQVYSVKIDASYLDDTGVKVERDFSFAFQVKNQFTVLSSVPGNLVQGVPVNTGIEFTFSSENFSDYEKNFTIVPKVEGTFQVRGRILTFVPKGTLKPATVYTVTLSKNIKVEGTDPLTENIVLQFETEPVRSDSSASYWYLYTNKIEFVPNTTMAFAVGGSEFDQEFKVKAYAFKSFDAYQKNYLKSLEIPYWAHETQKNFVVPQADITLSREFSLKPQSYKNNYDKYLVFPESLPKGVYWLEISYDKQTQHIFVEVTDIATHAHITTNKSLVWVNSLATKGALSGADVSLLGGKNLGKTAADGTVLFDTTALDLPKPEDISDRSFSVQEMAPKVLKLSARGEQSLFRLDISPYALSTAQSRYDDYIFNFSSDRSLYQPTDTIQFWGYITKADKTQTSEKFTVGIPNPNNYFYGRSLGNLVFLHSLEVTPDEKGFFRGEFKINNLTPGSYNLVLNQGETQLETRYLEVSPYVKPSYTLSLGSDKQAVFVGENVQFKADVDFFEGTPVPNYKLNYDLNSQSSGGTVTTDKNGEAQFDITTKLNTACDFFDEGECYNAYSNSRYQTLSVTSDSIEESPLRQYLGVSIYPARVDGIVDALVQNKTQALVSSTWKNVDLSVLNDDDYSNDDKVLTSPARNKKVKGVIRETRFEKKETGEYYDFISKSTQKTYSYEPVVTVVARFEGVTDNNGRFEYPFARVANRSYDVIMLVEDGNGAKVSQVAYVYSSEPYQDGYESTWYSLRNGDKNLSGDTLSFGYKIGDTVKLGIYKNDVPLESVTGPVLFTLLQDGLQKYTVQKSPEYSFTFEEKNIPNVYVGMIYFDGTKYITSAEGDYRNSIRFDTRERDLKIVITPNKAGYKPGEKINLDFKTTDKNGKAHPARINVSVIDEAFLAVGSYGSGYHTFAAANPVQYLYRNVSDGTLFVEKSHKSADLGVFGGAEGGGCFLPGTKITLANGKTKNIEDIQVGDVILTFKNEVDNTVVSGKVTKLQTHIVSEYLILNGKIQVTPEHRILVNGQWATAGDIQKGDILRGQNGENVEIVSIEQRYELVKVYNFEVENYHTYIAEGVYVHNDKGGVPTRSYFPDVAYYGFVDTDKSGKATLSFTLPDSVTSWRVTGEGVSTDRYGGIGDTNVKVSLPVFGIFSVPKDLLTGDKPSPFAAAYGNALKPGEKVDLTASGDLFTSSIVQKNTAFERSLFPATKPAEKSGKVKLQVNSARGNDALEQKFSVVDSRVVQKEQISLPVKDGPLDLGSAKNAPTAIELRFADAGRGSLYSRVYRFLWSGGNRLDQKAGTIVAKDWFKDFFPEDQFSAQEDLTPFIGQEGFKLLPYGSVDTELSAKVAALLKDTSSFDKERMRLAFVGQLYNTNVTEGELASALWGAAALGEPVIPSIRSLAEKSQDLRTKIFLALAATELGDHEYARSLYEDVLKETDETKTFAKVTLTDDKLLTLENTALMSIVAARLQEPIADKFDHFVTTENKQNVYDVEELLFIKEKLQKLSGTSAKANLVLDGQTYPLDFSSGNSHVITVLPHQLSSLSVSGVEGEITLFVTYDTGVNSTQSTNKVSLARKYFVDGKEVNTFKEGDKVEVRLYPTFGKDAPPGNYVIVDSLPSGLKLTSQMDLFSPWISSWCPGGYPFEVNGQTIKFMVDRDFQKLSVGYDGGYNGYNYCAQKDYISYVTRVSTLGEFRREAALIQSVESNDIKNLSTDTGMVQITQ